MSEPRRWFIDPRPHSGHRGGFTQRHTAWETRPSLPWAARCVPVVEASAFEDVKEKLRIAEIELAEIKAARARANTNPVCADCNALLARF